MTAASPMDLTFLDWALLALVIGAGLAVAFTAWSYVLALSLTRGAFGWPGLLHMARETFLVSFTQAALPFGWLGSGAPRLSSDRGERRPVVFVHGYVQNRSNFMWLSRWLGARGLGPFYGFNYFSLGPVEQSARALGRFVDRVRAETGADQVDLVCHSLGGLVARAYVDLLGGHAAVRRVVTLGSPHRGLLHAKIGFGSSCADMHPSTGFILKLDSAPLPETVSYCSIYSTHDNIVFPSEASSLGSRGRNIVVRGHGHFGILFSAEVAEHVYGALTLVEAAASVAPAGDSAVLIAETRGQESDGVALSPVP